MWVRNGSGGTPGLRKTLHLSSDKSWKLFKVHFDRDLLALSSYLAYKVHRYKSDSLHRVKSRQIVYRSLNVVQLFIRIIHKTCYYVRAYLARLLTAVFIGFIDLTAREAAANCWLRAQPVQKVLLYCRMVKARWMKQFRAARNWFVGSSRYNPLLSKLPAAAEWSSGFKRTSC